MTTNQNGRPTRKVAEPKGFPCPGAISGAEDLGDTLDGTLVGISNDALVISTVENRQHSFRVAKDAYVCCDGVTCGVENLKIGSKIRLTAHANDKDVATIIESLTNQIDFADHH